jgi:hypothetical protein
MGVGSYTSNLIQAGKYVSKNLVYLTIVILDDAIQRLIYDDFYYCIEFPFNKIFDLFKE